MATTADLVGIIMQHVYEPLYTFDAKGAVVPMLAEEMPKISADGKVYTHRRCARASSCTTGAISTPRTSSPPEALDGDDAARQGGGQEQLVDHPPRGRSHVEISPQERLRRPLLAHLALPSRHGRHHGEGDASPSRWLEFVGTGPYKFRSASPTSTCCSPASTATRRARRRPAATRGKREAKIEELRFVPVPNANTRVEGVVAGQYHFADLLPVEAHKRLSRASGAARPCRHDALRLPLLPDQHQAGPDGGPEVRQAFQMALGEGRCCSPASATRDSSSLEGNHFPRARRSIRRPAPAAYNKRDAEGAKKLWPRGRVQGRADPHPTSRSSTTSTTTWRW